MSNTDGGWIIFDGNRVKAHTFLFLKYSCFHGIFNNNNNKKNVIYQYLFNRYHFKIVYIISKTIGTQIYIYCLHVFPRCVSFSEHKSYILLTCVLTERDGLKDTGRSNRQSVAM